MEADYIIVGAGSAGCATAFRLCEAGHRVIVLEYGGSDRSSSNSNARSIKLSNEYA